MYNTVTEWLQMLTGNVCIRIRAYIYIYKYASARVYIYRHGRHAHINVCTIYIQPPTYICRYCIYSNVYIRIHTYMHIPMVTHIGRPTVIYIYIYIQSTTFSFIRHAYARTHIHAHIHTHIHTCFHVHMSNPFAPRLHVYAHVLS